MHAENMGHIEEPPAAGRKVPPGFVKALGEVIGDRDGCVRLILRTPLAELGATTRVQLQESVNPAVIE